MELLKNRYNDAFFVFLNANLKKAFPAWNKRAFLQKIYDTGWENRGLKDRMRHITLVLGDHLPGSFPEQLSILKKAIGEGHALEQLFFPDFVECFGMHPEHEEEALNALHFFTPYATAEFAIRPFILRSPEKIMAQLQEWADSENHHVRRLASEGCRPRLPWGMALKPFRNDPSLVFPILEKLKTDPSEYVRRSVANNLNDISKDHPGLILDIARKWQGKQARTDKLLKHACRTLLKQGNPMAMQLFGFNDPAEIKVKHLSATPDPIHLGESLEFSFELESAKALGKVRLEFAVDFMKNNGKTSRKVFFISENQLNKKHLDVVKKQAFIDRTTRKHYAGKHGLAILVNGMEKAGLNFNLILSE